MFRCIAEEPQVELSCGSNKMIAIFLLVMSFLFAITISYLIYLVTKKEVVSSVVASMVTSFAMQEANKAFFGYDKFYFLAAVFSFFYLFILSVLFIFFMKKL